MSVEYRPVRYANLQESVNALRYTVKFREIKTYNQSKDETYKPALEGYVKVLMYEADDPCHSLWRMQLCISQRKVKDEMV